VNGFQLTESYVLGQGDQQLAMFDGDGNWQRSNVYAVGKLIATYDLITDPSSTNPDQVPALHFHLTDPLGTRRLQTSSVGQPETDCQSFPFGDQLFCFPDANAPGTADDATPLHFTGKERDSESGNDYFGARYYASSMGRFMSPDWIAKAEPVPYAKLDDPQSLNLYAYVRNNPLVRADLDGHADCGGQGQQPCPPPPPPPAPNPNPPQPTPNPNPPAPTPTPNPAPPVTPLAGVLPPAADAAAQAAKQAAKGIPKPTPNPIPRPVPGPDPVPPQLLPGDPGPPPPGLTGRTLGWIILQFFKAIGDPNVPSMPVMGCVTCQQQMQEMQRQHDMYCGKNNPDCSAELWPEKWPNLAEELKVPRRS
jgi:RHS repeat-associated protein